MTKNEKFLAIDKLSDLLMWGMKDLQTVIKEQNTKVNMAEWLILSVNNTCEESCIAGAVMYQTLGVRQNEKIRGSVSVGPFTMYEQGVYPRDEPEYNLIQAINEIRCGEFEDAHKSFQLGKSKDTQPLPKGCPTYIHVTSYHENFAQFYFDLGTVYSTLKEHGL